jgi:type II secretory pathway pseudopilin PulG
VSLSVTGTNGHGSAYFNILPPGSDNVAIYNSSSGDQTTTVKLPESGEYKIRVYLMGNDNDAGKTVGYNVDVSIQ